MLDNYVSFQEGVPKRLHFTDHALQDRLTPDPLLGFAKMLTVLVLVVDEEDGYKVSKTLSVTSGALAGQLSGYLVDRLYRGYDFVITRRGAGFGTRYSVTGIPRPG